MPRKGQSATECAQSQDRVLCAIVDAYRAGRYPSADLVAVMVGLTGSTVKSHIANLRDAHLLTARYAQRCSLEIQAEAFTRRDALLAIIPVFSLPRRRRSQLMDARAGGLTTRTIYGREHYQRMGQIGGARFWRTNPTAATRLAAARAMAAQKRRDATA